jgi:hypothetical protein
MCICDHSETWWKDELHTEGGNKDRNQGPRVQFWGSMNYTRHSVGQRFSDKRAHLLHQIFKVHLHHRSAEWKCELSLLWALGTRLQQCMRGSKICCLKDAFRKITDNTSIPLIITICKTHGQKACILNIYIYSYNAIRRQFSKIVQQIWIGTQLKKIHTW